MSIFELLVYSCVTLNGLGGNSFSKTCDTKTTGELFLKINKCTEIGLSRLGSKIFSDVYENRIIENFKCNERSIIE